MEYNVTLFDLTCKSGWTRLKIKTQNVTGHVAQWNKLYSKAKKKQSPNRMSRLSASVETNPIWLISKLNETCLDDAGFIFCAFKIENMRERNMKGESFSQL